MENLLSLTEFLQWKLYIHERCRDSTMNKELKYWLTMLPLKDLPRSKIVYSGGTKSAGAPRSASPKLKIVYTNESQSVKTDTNSADHRTKFEDDDSKDPNMEHSLHSAVTGVFIRGVKEKARDLYLKYIRVGAEFEVNINSGLRYALKGLLDDKERWLNNEEFDDLIKLRDMFDPVCEVMRSMMNQSFLRFLRSEYFAKIKSEIEE